MLFWATILSFLIGIMTYMYYPRNDQVQTSYVPASESYIANFVTQHQAAKDYLREALVGLQELPTAAAGSYENDSIFVLSGIKDGAETYMADFLPNMQGLVTTNDIRPRLQEDFVSVLACFNHPDRRIGYENGKNIYMGNSLTNCFSEDAQVRYVFTYGPLPDDMDTPLMRDKPLLWESAILKRTHGNPDCGFLQKKNGRYYINNSSRLTRTIPTAFVEFLGLYLGPTSANRVTITIGQDEVPLLFCMTPANDPYPRKQMILNYDSLLNAGIAGDHKKELSELSNGWVDLSNGLKNGENYVKHNGAISGNDGKWHILSAEAVSNKNHFDYHDKGFSFAADRVIDTKFKQGEFGNAFTISFLGLFRENTAGVIGASDSEVGFNCSSATAEEPCLNVKYENEQLQFELKSADNRISVVKGTVKKHQISQIDYVVNPNQHRLYVNGLLADSKSYTDETDASKRLGDNGDGIIKGLAKEAGFYIGRDANGTHWTNGTLYNFLVYKRSMELITDADSPEVRAQHFDIMGLARVHITNKQRYDYQHNLFKDSKTHNRIINMRKPTTATDD